MMTLLPRVALWAVIMVVAIQHFDPWSTQLIKRRAVSSGGQRRFLIIDILVAVAVAVLSITVNIVLAVFLGTIIAVMLFVVRMSRSIIRRTYRCHSISSRRSRDARETQALERHGDYILVMELQGALFFGTGERLVDEIAAATQQETRSLILDLRRISERQHRSSHHPGHTNRPHGQGKSSGPRAFKKQRCNVPAKRFRRFGRSLSQSGLRRRGSRDRMGRRQPPAGSAG